MLTLVVFAALAQPPQKIAVVHGSNLGVSAKRVADASLLLLDVLKAEKLEPIESRLPCEDRACLLATAKELGTAAVMSMSFAPLSKDTIVSLEAWDAAGRQLSHQTFTLKGADTKLPAEARTFAQAVRKELEAPPAVVAKDDTPKETKLVPPPETGEPPPELIVERPERSRAPAIAVGAGAVAVGVAAVILLALASGESAEANRTVGPMMAAHPKPEADRLISSANTKYTASMATGIGAAALAVTSMVLFVY